jgi:hypothetical protein
MPFDNPKAIWPISLMQIEERLLPNSAPVVFRVPKFEFVC